MDVHDIAGLVSGGCIIGGALMSVAGWDLSRRELNRKVSLDDAIAASKDVVAATAQAIQNPPPVAPGIAPQLQAGAQALPGLEGYLTGLAAVAKSLTNLTPAIAAFVIASILFVCAAGLAAVNVTQSP